MIPKSSRKLKLYLGMLMQILPIIAFVFALLFGAAGRHGLFPITKRMRKERAVMYSSKEANERTGDRPEECYSCGYATSQLVYYDLELPASFTNTNSAGWLCNVCASTLASNAYHYPSQFEDDRNILQQICYCTNLVLANQDLILAKQRKIDRMLSLLYLTLVPSKEKP